MTAEELNWLLQTIKDVANAERFVLAQYKRGRISFQLMADIARKRGWINRTANQFAIRHDPLLNPVRNGRICNCYCPRGVAACPSKTWKMTQKRAARNA
jgi:hypothetical protein